MNLQTEFNTTQSNADFLSEHWRPEHCDPQAWNAPSTYGVVGVILVDRDGNPLEEGDKSGMYMKKFTRSWDNPTRFGGTSLKRVRSFAEIIRSEGKGIKPSDPIYFDFDTDERINGNGRYGAAEKCGIAGWMHQGVRFLSLEAKILFAALSQPQQENGVFGEVLTRDDVYATVKTLCETTQGEKEWDEDYIKEMTDRVGPHLSDKDKVSIRQDLRKDFISNPKMEYSGVQSYDVGTHVTFLNTMPDDVWVENIYNNEEEYVQFVTTDQGKFTHSYSALMSKTVRANEDQKPLHLIVNLRPPSGKFGSLEALRDEFFSKHVKRLEDLILKSSGLPADNISRLRFAWNHPDCQHMALAQDRSNEKNRVVVPLRNREFN